MLELAYNNQTVLDRLLDVHTEYNRSKFEDEHLMSQKYKANILKFPRDWREINEKMRRIQEDIRFQVLSMRTGKGRKRKKPQWLKQKEAYEAMRAERIAKEFSETAQQERILRGKDKLKVSEKTRNAVPDRKLPDKNKKVEQETTAGGKKRLTGKQKKERIKKASDGVGKNNEDQSCNEKETMKKDGPSSETDHSTIKEHVDEEIASSATEDEECSSEDPGATVRDGTLSETDHLTVEGESVAEHSDDTENNSSTEKNN
ncbi:uncharacterized protein LOC118200619 [Stegodyphus dumicola]|uniref:uncharacterized protein LOC118200619 n=1 Tax=Stegodyphus dumicola TaxID=202533 RepID=UPI0015A92ACF|nr:uncharacterized protein LOC118200619 [Stegodyphus dumicola]